MNISNDLPLVLYRFDHHQVLNEFIASFQDDFKLLVCGTDLDAEIQLKKYGKDICAIVVEQDSVHSPLFKLSKTLSPQSLRILLHRDIALGTVVSLLEQGAINKCFAKPYDCNVIRSEIYAAYIGVQSRQQYSPLGKDKITTYYALIVDDEISATKYLKKQLEQLSCPCEILVADDASEALKLFEQYQSSLALIITDQRMPGMLGNQLLTEIRNHNPNIVRILTSAYEEVDVALNAVNEGQIFRYIRKPWDAQDVRSCIESALNEYLSKIEKTTEHHSLLIKQFQNIILQREASLIEQLRSTVDTYGGAGTLLYFFDCLACIATLPPTTASVRASEETDLESELVSEFTHCILSRLAKISKQSKFTTVSRVKFYDALSNVNFEANEIESLHPTGVEITILLKQLLDASSLKFDVLEFKHQDGLFLIKTKTNNRLSIFKHLLSAHTRMPPQMMEQQCAMLLLIVVCRHMGGNVFIEGGKQMFSLTISLPDSEQSGLDCVNDEQ